MHVYKSIECIEMPTKDALILFNQSSIVTELCTRCDQQNHVQRLLRCKIELGHLCDDVNLPKGSFRGRVLDSVEFYGERILDHKDRGKKMVIVPLVDTENLGKSNRR